jgi:hypothetical protein
MFGLEVARRIARCIAGFAAAATILLALAAPASATALSSLPERATYIETGTVYVCMPFSPDAQVLIAPTLVPGGSAGLEPPVEIVAYSWAADGASIDLLVRGTTSGLYREFNYDLETTSLAAVAGPSPTRPATFSDGSPVDPAPDAPARSPDGGDAASIRPGGDPSAPQVFLSMAGGAAVRIGPEEVRGRACSRVSFSAGGRYVIYDVSKPDGGSEVWVTTVGQKRADSFLISASGSNGAWQPYYRPGSAGGSTSSGTGRKACPGPFGLLGLAGVGAAGGAYRRRRR